MYTNNRDDSKWKKINDTSTEYDFSILETISRHFGVYNVALVIFRNDDRRL